MNLNNNFFYYNRFVQLKPDEAKDIAVPLINELKDDNLNIFECGTGFGSLSIPIIKFLEEEGKIEKWYGVEKDKEKISRFFSLYNSYDSIKQEIKESRKKKFEEYKNIFQKLPDNYNKPDFINIEEFDIDHIKKYCDLNLKFNNINVLFVPFIFQHVNKWRSFLKHIFDHLNFSRPFIIVSGELSGDWETLFSPWQATTYLEWKCVFIKIWENISLIKSSLRDYRYQNLSIFYDFLRNNKLEISKIFSKKIEYVIKTTIKEVLSHFENKTWSCVVQNLDNYDFNKEKIEQIFNPKEYEAEKEFISIHKFNYFIISKGTE